MLERNHRVTKLVVLIGAAWLISSGIVASGQDDSGGPGAVELITPLEPLPLSKLRESQVILPSSTGGLEVSSWSWFDADESGGQALRGWVRNASANTMSDISLKIAVSDKDSDQIRTVEISFPQQLSVSAGSEVAFEARFPVGNYQGQKLFLMSQSRRASRRPSEEAETAAKVDRSSGEALLVAGSVPR